MLSSHLHEITRSTTGITNPLSDKQPGQLPVSLAPLQMTWPTPHAQNAMLLLMVLVVKLMFYATLFPPKERSRAPGHPQQPLALV